MRRGSSLVEVLVATVLLAVGVAGTLASLAASARLRTAARAEEHVAAVALEAFNDFVAHGCSVVDSSSTTHADSSGPTSKVRIERGADRAALELDVSLQVPLLRAHIQLQSEHPCA